MSMKILIIKLSSLGDVLQTTPLVRSLSCQHNVYFLTYKQNKILLENNPNISRLFILEPLAGNLLLPLRVIKNTLTLLFLAVARPNISVNLHKVYKMNMLLKWLGIRRRIGLVRAEHDHHYLTDAIIFNQEEHHIHQYLKVADILKCKVLGYKMDYFPMKKNGDLSRKFNIDHPYFVCAPGGGRNRWAVMPNKRWLVESFVELFNQFPTKDIYLVFIGDKFDAIIIKSILSRVGDEHHAINVASKLSIDEIFRLVAGSLGYIGNDSFLLHLASTTGKPTLGLFGPTNGKLLAPLGSNDCFIQSSSECSPCYDANLGLNSRAYLCQDSICMKAITTEQVLSKIQHPP